MSEAAAKPVRAGIVVTGTEVITGTIQDKNGPWISQELAGRGVEVSHIVVVGDRPSDLEQALRFLGDDGMDLIVTSGGLGPTADDLTAEVVGTFAGREMVLDESMEEKIAKILAGFARRLNFDAGGAPRGEPQAGGRARGLDADRSRRNRARAGRARRRRPGRDRHARAAARAPRDVAEGARDGACSGRPRPRRAVRGRDAPPVRHSRVRDREDACARSRRAASRSTQLEITTCLRKGELEIEIRHRPGAEDALAAARSPASTSATAASSSAATARRSTRSSPRSSQGHRIATAESCTGGLLAARLTELDGASAYVMGGAVTYTNESKTKVLGVPAELIAEHGAVSPEVAEAMADGALERVRRGHRRRHHRYRRALGGTEEKPVGYVCVCVKSADGREDRP